MFLFMWAAATGAATTNLHLKALFSGLPVLFVLWIYPDTDLFGFFCKFKAVGWIFLNITYCTTRHAFKVSQQVISSSFNTILCRKRIHVRYMLLLCKTKVLVFFNDEKEMCIISSFCMATCLRIPIRKALEELTKINNWTKSWSVEMFAITQADKNTDLQLVSSCQAVNLVCPPPLRQCYCICLCSVHTLFCTLTECPTLSPILPRLQFLCL